MPPKNPKQPISHPSFMSHHLSSLTFCAMLSIKSSWNLKEDLEMCKSPEELQNESQRATVYLKGPFLGC